METHEVLVIGAGISGASFAFHAARAGKRVLVLEEEARAGGCLATRAGPEGFWYELGAHTCYNSYGAFLELLEGTGLAGELQTRAKPVLRFLDGERVLPGKNLGLLLRRFSKLELLAAVPRWIGAKPAGKTVREHYGRLVGARNYERVLGPMLSAVPSQTADDIPAEMLFKKRARREDVLRSFTLKGGLARAVEAALRTPGVELRLGAAAERVERVPAGFAVTLADGERVEARLLALAVPPGRAARLLRALAPEPAALAERVHEVEIDSLGLAVRAERTCVPFATFLIPLADRFHSIVTRDVVPDPERRAFTLHFRPGTSTAERRARACEVLGIAPSDMESASERRHVLPSPRLGHAELVRAIEAALPPDLALTGNWFGGLAIEDCVLRSRSEWRRLASA